MVGPPIPIGVFDEIVVEIAWVVGHFANDPRRQRDLVGGIRHFDFCDEQAIIVAVENIDLPSTAGKGLLIAGLLDERPLAQKIEHLDGVGEGDGIFEFQPVELP